MKRNSGQVVREAVVQKEGRATAVVQVPDEARKMSVSAKAYLQLLQEVKHLQTAVSELSGRLAPVLSHEQSDPPLSDVTGNAEQWPEYFESLRGLANMVSGTREEVDSILSRLGLE